MRNKISDVSEIFEKNEWESDVKNWHNVPKSKEIRKKLEGDNAIEFLKDIHIGKEDKGFFLYTFKKRSKFFKSQEDIPVGDIKFYAQQKRKEEKDTIKDTEKRGKESKADKKENKEGSI